VVDTGDELGHGWDYKLMTEAKNVEACTTETRRTQRGLGLEVLETEAKSTY
jgi:hypothetical protein